MTRDLATIARDLARLFGPRIVALGLVAVLNLALFTAVLRPAAKEAAARREGAARVAAQQRAAEAVARTHADLLAARRRADAYAAGFPARTELLALTNRLQGAARRLALRVPAMDYHPDMQPAPGAALDRLTIAMRVEGPYGDIRRFVHEVEALRRRVVIDTMTLRGRGAGGTVQLALELSAYTRLTAVLGGASSLPPVARPGVAAATAPALPSTAAIEVPAFKVELLDLPPPPYEKARRNLFAGLLPSFARRSLRPAPAVAATLAKAPPSRPLASATPPPAPAPDPFYEEARQLRFLGTTGGTDGPRAVVSRGADVLLVRVNDRVGARHVVRDVQPEALVLRSLEGDKEVTLFLKEAPRNAP